MVLQALESFFLFVKRVLLLICMCVYCCTAKKMQKAVHCIMFILYRLNKLSGTSGSWELLSDCWKSFVADLHVGVLLYC